MGVRIATWNVNSIRSRVDRVEAWLERNDCDVLALQETKATESQFPMLRHAAGDWLAADPGAQIALMGDWNIAPQDEDVWDMADFAGSTHVSAPERAAFQAFVDAGFTDVARAHTPGPGVYTYWDYKQLSFPKRRGMRIDFVLGSPALSSRVEGAAFDREERKGKGASDHVPVIVELADGPGTP